MSTDQALVPKRIHPVDEVLALTRLAAYGLRRAGLLRWYRAGADPEGFLPRGAHRLHRREGRYHLPLSPFAYSTYRGS